MNAPDNKVLEEAYFAIYYDRKGTPIHIEGPKGPAEPIPEDDAIDGNIKTIETKLLSYGPEEDVCCAYKNGQWVCWC